MFSALKTRDYRLLFAGQGISALGDQFHLIALPWLVLTLTHDPAQLGLVLALAGVPRALLMLVGGAWADRHSPRAIMLVSDVARFALAGALAAAILAGAVEMWMVYATALAFGLVSGFFMPAAESAVPRVLESEQYESGNSLIMGAGQLASFLGPAAAGVLIAAAAAGAAEAATLLGLGLAFVVDAASFLASAVTLVAMHRLPASNAQADTHPLADVAAGLRYAWRSERIRWMVIVIAAANFLVAGPIFVGLPVLAQSRLEGGAAALGVVVAAYGLGSLVGMLGSAGLPRPSDRVFSWLVVGLLAGFGVAMGALGFAHHTWVAAALMLATGLGNGYIAVIVMTSLQRMADEAFLGRVMSLVVLSMVGLVPVSQALAGVVVGLSPAALFLGAGAGFAALAAIAFVKRSVWTVEGEVLDSAPPIHTSTADVHCTIQNGSGIVTAVRTT